MLWEREARGREVRGRHEMSANSEWLQNIKIFRQIYLRIFPKTGHSLHTRHHTDSQCYDHKIRDCQRYFCPPRHIINSKYPDFFSASVASSCCLVTTKCFDGWDEVRWVRQPDIFSVSRVYNAFLSLQTEIAILFFFLLIFLFVFFMQETFSKGNKRKIGKPLEKIAGKRPITKSSLKKYPLEKN